MQLVEMIRDTPVLQHFVGIDTYEAKCPFEPSTLTKFCHRIAPISELLRQVSTDHIRERLVAHGVDVSELIIDATAVPLNIKFPPGHAFAQSKPAQS